MAKQITRKLDHEKGKLRDKASNSNYRERFQEEGGCFERGGTHGNRLILADFQNFSAVQRKFIAQDRATAWLVFESKIRSLPLKVGGFNFSFKQTLASFAVANDMLMLTAQKHFPALHTLAAEQLRMTKGRFLAAEPWGREEVNKATGKGRIELYLTFKTFVTTAHPQPWRSFFKRLRLDPVEQGTEELA